MIQIGDAVVYVDPVAVPHNALVTQVWSQECLNVVFVSGDTARGDSYGRQIERSTSLMHQSIVPVHGNYWRLPTETPKNSEHL